MTQIVFFQHQALIIKNYFVFRVFSTTFASEISHI